MRVERILLRDIGPFREETIELPPGKDPKLADVYLLTGENGTGKSTVLYALAGVLAGGIDELGRDFLHRRMRSRDAFALVRTTDHGDLLALDRDVGMDGLSRWPLKDGLGIESAIPGRIGTLAHFRSVLATKYWNQVEALLFSGADDRRWTFEWAAFAYAGIRTMRDAPPQTLQELKASPFSNSLSFVDTADSNQLAQWIVNQQFKGLKASQRGDTEAAKRVTDALREIERCIGDITGDPTFAFDTTDNIEVRVRWRGNDIPLELLPDGLKSIVSWIADLLMRLDRIPWTTDAPVVERPFLLLLDEIDIHLHPAWQRKVLPLIQALFPNAQIIATTHSPFVVTSAIDATIITLEMRDGNSRVAAYHEPKVGSSYSAVLRSVFGVTSEFDVDTEAKLEQFQRAKRRLLAGDESAQGEIDQLTHELAQRGEELTQILAVELAQLRRQLARVAP